MTEALCIAEQVAVALLAKLVELKTAGTVVDAIRAEEIGQNVPLDDGVVLLLQDDPKPIKGSIGHKTWRQVFVAACPIIPTPASGIPVDKRINQTGAAIAKKLLESPTLGTLLCASIEWEGNQAFPANERKVDGVLVPVTVTYRHLATDPFQQ